MISNYYTLALLTRAIHGQLEGKTISEAISQDKGKLVFIMEDAPSLVVDCTPDGNCMYLDPRFSKARKNTASILPAIWGERFESAGIHPYDRVVSIRLSSGRELVMLLFGARGNVLLVGAGGRVEGAFHDEKKHKGTQLETKAQQPPPDIAVHLQSGDGITLLQALKKSNPQLGSQLSREVLYRAGVKSDTVPDSIDDASRDRIVSSLQSVLHDLRTPSPRIYLPIGKGTDRAMVFSTIPLLSLHGYECRVYDGVNEAVREVRSHRHHDKRFEDTRKKFATSILRLRDSTERALSAMRDESEASATSDTFEQYGNLILSHIHDLKKGDAELRVMNGPIDVVPLERSLSPQQNAQRYFEKAKKNRAARELLITRKRTTEERLNMLERALEHLDEVSTQEELNRYMKQTDIVIHGPGHTSRDGGGEALPFRVFEVEGGFRVLAGKSNTNNDLLTMKFARPKDLWFHVRGVGGSHVILQVASSRGEPGKKAREMAAAIAAYYSKMRKASNVPVVMTEKKFVRKPRGADPGSVVIEREKVLFVRPGLPKGSTETDE